MNAIRVDELIFSSLIYRTYASSKISSQDCKDIYNIFQRKRCIQAFYNHDEKPTYARRAMRCNNQF
jgi:hypothetical protein